MKLDTPSVSDQRLNSAMQASGAPEACIAEFKRWSETLGVSSFILRLRHAHSGGPPHREIVKSIERFGRDVIPYL